MQRQEIDGRDIVTAMRMIGDKVEYRLQQKGRGAYAGPHECYGIVAEEFKELMDALHANDRQGFGTELIDIAVACVIGLASTLMSRDTPATVVASLREHMTQAQWDALPGAPPSDAVGARWKLVTEDGLIVCEYVAIPGESLGVSLREVLILGDEADGRMDNILDGGA